MVAEFVVGFLRIARIALRKLGSKIIPDMKLTARNNQSIHFAVNRYIYNVDYLRGYISLPAVRFLISPAGVIKIIRSRARAFHKTLTEPPFWSEMKFRRSLRLRINSPLNFRPAFGPLSAASNDIRIALSFSMFLAIRRFSSVLDLRGTNLWLKETFAATRWN